MATLRPQVTGRAAFSIAEVTVSTGLGRDTIYRAIREGRLVARKFGRRTLITDRDLQQFLDALPEKKRA
jgi:excisionase family DNA binding protein